MCVYILPNIQLTREIIGEFKGWSNSHIFETIKIYFKKQKEIDGYPLWGATFCASYLKDPISPVLT